MAKKESKELVSAEPSGFLTPFEEAERWFEGGLQKAIFFTGSPVVAQVKNH
jgi:hypothetical protein